MLSQDHSSQIKKMDSKLALRIFLSWALPFFGSFLFFRPNPATGEMELAMDKNTFKCIIAALASPLFSYFLAQSVPRWNAWESVARVCAAFLIGNLLLDVLFLLPMSKMSVQDYLVEIGALYAVLIAAQGMFGYSIATSPVPRSDSLIGVLLRTPLPTLTSYVAISFVHDEKQEKLLLPEWHFRSFMVLVAQATIGLNLVKALQQLQDVKKWAIPVTLLFIVATLGFDYLMICPVFKWSVERYLAERGFRLLSTTGFAVVAMKAASLRPARVHQE